MFVELFLKECRQLLKCLTYYVLLICLFLFYYSQLGEFQIYEKPLPNQEDYGFKYSEDENVIMNTTVSQLVMEYFNNRYAAYPIGFYKTVTLSGNKFDKMSKIVAEVTGLSEDELKTTVENYLSDVTAASDPIKVAPAENLTYERFLELMKAADKLLGGGSNYSSAFMQSNARVPMTYEDALQVYNKILEKDHLTGAYARLFCDYMGILLAILPVFIAVTRGLRDKRAKASEVIFARKVSSFSIIASRYLAMLVMLLLPVLLLSVNPLLQCISYGKSIGTLVDSLAFIKYILGWLLPTIMVSLSVGVFLSELTETAIAIFVQGIWWFVSLFTGMANMQGGYGWNLIPRHNTLLNYDRYRENFHTLLINRITYASIAIVLIMAALLVYEMKRKGRLILRGKIFTNRKNKS
jgi:hypothetical protein